MGPMNAVSYLVSRKSYNPVKCSVALFFGSLLAYANLIGLFWIQANVPQASSVKAVDWTVSTLVVLTTMAVAALGAISFFGVQLHSLTQLTTTITRFAENRILDELTSTGLSIRTILNQLLAYHLKRASIIALPASFAWMAISQSRDVVPMTLLYVMVMASIGFICLCMTCWKVATGRTGRLFMIAPLVVLGGPPLLYFQFFKPELYSCLATAVYLVVASYYLSLKALEARGEFQGVAYRIRQALSLKRKKSLSSENAIVARQEAIGKEWGDLVSYVVSGLAMLCALGLSWVENSPVPIFVVLLLAGFVACLRAASKLSQSLTGEVEDSTLEILRTTPLGSERFLNGWLELTVRPLQLEVAFLCVTALAFSLTTDPRSLANGSLVFCIAVALALPHLGALFGASIAGQLKPRSEVAGQLSYTVLFVGLFAFPQMMAIASIDQPVWLCSLLTMGLFWVACWVLRAGATKSLNRVFLPRN